MNKDMIIHETYSEFQAYLIIWNFWIGRKTVNFIEDFFFFFGGGGGMKDDTKDALQSRKDRHTTKS